MTHTNDVALSGGSSVVFLLCSPICSLLLIYFLIPAWTCLTKSVLPETGDSDYREGQLWLVLSFNFKMNCIRTCNWKLQYQICTYYATRYFASVTITAWACRVYKFLPILLLSCRRQDRFILKPADLDNNLYFSSFQTGVPHYEDFISKAGKLHSHLKWVVQYQPWPILVAVTLMLSNTQCTTSNFMRAFYLKLSIFCSGSLPRIYEPFSLNIRVLEGVRVSYWSCSPMLWLYFIRPL